MESSTWGEGGHGDTKTTKDNLRKELLSKTGKQVLETDRGGQEVQPSYEPCSPGKDAPTLS